VGEIGVRELGSDAGIGNWYLTPISLTPISASDPISQFFENPWKTLPIKAIMRFSLPPTLTFFSLKDVYD
jgi:hypothetical protein